MADTELAQVFAAMAAQPGTVRVPEVVARITVWSDGTVHVERPGEPSQVVAALRGGGA